MAEGSTHSLLLPQDPSNTPWGFYDEAILLETGFNRKKRLLILCQFPFYMLILRLSAILNLDASSYERTDSH